jgi:hypothetical protein
MARRDWSSIKSAHAYILQYLSEHETATENLLNTRHDPAIVSQCLQLLVERGVLLLKFDDRKTGVARRVYTLAEGVKV